MTRSLLLRSRLLLVTALACAGLCWQGWQAEPVVAQAQPQPQAPAPAPAADSQYQTTVSQAVKEFGLSNWAEARALFRRAHGLSPSARTFRGMGMAAFELKMYVEALRELTAALQDKARPLTEEQRTQVQSLIQQSRAYVGRYQVVLEPATAIPKVDGQDALFDPGNVLLLSLGDHVVSASAEGFQEVSVPLRVEGGEDLVLKIQLSLVSQPGSAPAPVTTPAVTASEPATKPAADSGSSTATTAGYVLLASAAVFGGGAAAFWVVGGSQYDDLEKSCGKTSSGCSDAEISKSGVETSDTLTTVGLGLAGASLIASAVCFVIGSGSDDEPSGTALRVSPMGVDLRGSF